jgi:malonyl-CoA O-methyltransferase
MNTVAGTSVIERDLPVIPRSAIARSFGDAAATYDEYAALQRTVADRLMQGFANLDVHVMLDLGSGTGYCAAGMQSRFPMANLVAMDLALPMLRQSANTVPGASLLCADAQALPLAGDAFDLVVSSLTLQWCADTRQFMQELHRILRPGGTALISTFGPASLATLKMAYSTVDADVHVNDFLPLSQLEQAARQARLRCQSTVKTETRYYDSLHTLARELKGIGAHNLNRGRPQGLTGRQKFMRAARAFQAQSAPGKGVPVAYEILYLVLTKPGGA